MSIVGSHLYELFSTGKFIEVESRKVIARDWGEVGKIGSYQMGTSYVIG